MTSSSRGTEAPSPSSASSSPNASGLDFLWNRMTGAPGLLLGLSGVLYVWGWPALQAMWGEAWLAPSLQDPFVLLWGGLFCLALLGRTLSSLFALLSPSTPLAEGSACLAEVAFDTSSQDEQWQEAWLQFSSGQWQKKTDAFVWERGRWGVWGRLFVLLALVIMGVVVGVDAFLSTGWLWNRTARLLAPWLLFGLLAQLWTPHLELWLIPSSKGFALHGRSLDGSTGALLLETQAVLEEFEAFVDEFYKTVDNAEEGEAQ